MTGFTPTTFSAVRAAFAEDLHEEEKAARTLKVKVRLFFIRLGKCPLRALVTCCLNTISQQLDVMNSISIFSCEYDRLGRPRLVWLCYLLHYGLLTKSTNRQSLGLGRMQLWLSNRHNCLLQFIGEIADRVLSFDGHHSVKFIRSQTF